MFKKKSFAVLVSYTVLQVTTLSMTYKEFLRQKYVNENIKIDRKIELVKFLRKGGGVFFCTVIYLCV